MYVSGFWIIVIVIGFCWMEASHKNKIEELEREIEDLKEQHTPDDDYDDDYDDY